MGIKVRRCIFLGLWILSLAGISFYGGAVSYGFFWGVTLIPVISLFYLLAVYIQLKIYQQVESRSVVCSEPMPYFFTLQNEGFCPFASISVNLFSSFSTVEALPGDKEYELLPGDRYTFKTRLICKYRGEYEVGVKEIIMTDFFRLIRVRYRIPSTIKALVRPRIIRVEELKCVQDMSMILQREAFRECTEPDIVVRDYVPGDALKQIHWKAAAREQKLKVRNRIGEEKQGITLLWDTRRFSKEPKEYLPVENRILEIVLALGIFMAERNIPFLAYYGQKGIASSHVNALGDFDGFYQKVSESRFDEDEDFARTLLAVEERGILYKSKIIFCVLHELSQDVKKLTKEFERAGVLTILYVVTKEDMEEPVRQGNERQRIGAVPVHGELEGRL